MAVLFVIGRPVEFNQTVGNAIVAADQFVGRTGSNEPVHFSRGEEDSKFCQECGNSFAD